MTRESLGSKSILSIVQNKRLFIVHLRNFFLLIQMAFLVSCLPMVNQFYVPSFNDGELIYPDGIGSRHIPIGIRFIKDGTRIETYFVKYHDVVYLKILINVPESETVQLHDYAAQLFFDKKPLPLKVEFYEINMVDPIYLMVPNKWTMGINRTMIGETEDVSFGFDKNYWLVSKLDTLEAELIRVVLPGFVINGEVTKFPEISFERKLIPWIRVINC
jgi:hypothetical protein